jgi:hypothetical protein
MTESKYPVMAEVMTELMKKINTDLEELVEMMELMKEADGTLFLNMCVTIRFFENFKKLKALVVAKEDEVSWGGKPSQPHAQQIAREIYGNNPSNPFVALTNTISDLNKDILDLCNFLQEQNKKKE